MLTTPANEQETTITVLRTENTITVYSCDTLMMAKLDKLTATHDDVRIVRQDDYGKWYEMPKSYLKFAAKRKCVLTPEQRSKMQEQAKLMRAKANHATSHTDTSQP